jgi:Na+/proline symporter
MVGARDDEARLLRAGRAFSLLWAVLLIVGATLFIPLSRETAAVEVALGIASLVYGGLLGAFALGVLTRRPGQAAAIIGVASGVGVVTLLRDQMAWPWYALVGASITFTVGSLVGRVAPRSEPARP